MYAKKLSHKMYHINNKDFNSAVFKLIDDNIIDIKNADALICYSALDDKINLRARSAAKIKP